MAQALTLLNPLDEAVGIAAYSGPLEHKANRAFSGPDAMNAPPPNAPPVLVIDDDPSVLEALGMLLEMWGRPVITAASEAEAVARLADGRVPPAAILADHRLEGGRTGGEAVARIRGMYPTPIPGILLTGAPHADGASTAHEQGMIVLQKPVRPDQLKTALDRAIDPGSG